MPWVPDSAPEVFSFIELFLLEEDAVWPSVAPFLVLISCELLVVVEAVSVLLAQELRKATPAMQMVEVMMDFFIGL